MIEEEIAKRFLEILDKNGLTKYEYAKKSSVSKNSIYNLAGGKNLGVHTLNSVCEDMGINLYNFFSYQVDDDTVICEDDKEKALVRVMILVYLVQASCNTRTSVPQLSGQSIY